MSPATILALVSALGTIIQDTPAALALYNSVVAMISGGAEPTAEQWASLVSSMATSHAAVQAG